VLVAEFYAIRRTINRYRRARPSGPPVTPYWQNLRVVNVPQRRP
jgi:hypothetical protein